jgi:tRNA(Ile)-lysidine synthase
MQKEFQQFIEKHELCISQEKILLAISGGIDSMTMLHLFLKSGYFVAIAHCNFQLRGQESDGDQNFVEEFAAENKLERFTIKFDTANYAKANKLSVQMAARELRYNWFSKIANENNFSKIAVAHNLNDVAETFFINLTRSTGIRGLAGIKPIQGKIIRPLLFASRNKIVEFARQEKIKFREDSSNADSKYLRNAIRHNIIPAFEDLNPSFLDSMYHTTQIVEEISSTYFELIQELKNKILIRRGDLYFIEIENLKELNVSPVKLYDILLEFGFNYENAVRILQNIDSQSGSTY